MRAPILSFLAFLLVASPAAAQTQAEPEATSGPAPKPLVTAEHDMIVAANPLAAKAGLEMLRQGGSAADAAIAALLVLNVVEPQSSGLGGGAFALVHSKTGLVAWDARETAPRGADPKMFLGPDGKPLPFLTAVASGRSIGVPGLARLMEELHDRHGKLPWADLFDPAIALARDGFPISPRLAGLIERYRDRLLHTDAGRVFLNKGKPLREGTILRNPALAETFESLSRLGADGLYQGPLAKAIAKAAQAEPRPGTLDIIDLGDYQVKERTPVCLDYRSRFRVCGMGPPSSGATTVEQILGLMERALPPGQSLDSPVLWHVFAEASALAYADRAAYLADPDFLGVPTRGLLDPHYLDQRAREIDPESAFYGLAYPGDPPWREGRLLAPDRQVGSPGTTHLSVIDADGLAIAVTASIETAFGSGRMAGGFLLNNQLTDFSFRPSNERGTPIANAVEPRKRPRSSMAPTIVYRPASPGTPLDRPYILAGSPGGSRIPEYVAAALVAMLDYGADPAAAAALPHVSQRNRGKLVLEKGAQPPAFAKELSRFGHKVEEATMTSGLHIIRIDPDGTLEGGADPRREGAALGD
jgi:gamma-glutamyltranspeptidase/glutathione hydrolase